jgi:hypothetical protein
VAATQELVVPEHPRPNVCCPIGRFDLDIDDDQRVIDGMSRGVRDWFAGRHLRNEVEDALLAAGRIEERFLFQPLGSGEVEVRRPLTEEEREELRQEFAEQSLEPLVVVVHGRFRCDAAPDCNRRRRCGEERGRGAMTMINPWDFQQKRVGMVIDDHDAI